MCLSPMFLEVVYADVSEVLPWGAHDQAKFMQEKMSSSLCKVHCN